MKNFIQSIKLKKKGIWIFISTVIFFITMILYAFLVKNIHTDEPKLYESSNPQNQILNKAPDTEDENENESEIMTEPSGDIPEQSEISEEPSGIGETTEETTLPPVKAKKIYQAEFDSLRVKYGGNEDIIGIVKIPGTVIYYPVAHYQYDNEYYLGRDLFKQTSAAGSICMDYENDVGRYDPSTILYGHQMGYNSMFHTINYYRDETFFNEHRYVIFNTIYENNVWEVFAFFETHISFNYIRIYFGSERDFLDLASQLKEKSLYDTGIEIKEGDRILVLSTCIGVDPDSPYRYVLCARMIKNKDNIPPDIAVQMANAVEDFK